MSDERNERQDGISGGGGPCKHCDTPVEGITNYGSRDYPLCPSCWHAIREDGNLTRTRGVPKAPVVVLHRRQAYQAPAIVYEGTLTTRAGSRPDGLAPSHGKGVEPDKLFGG